MTDTVRTLTDGNWAQEVQSALDADRRLGFASARELCKWLERREAAVAQGSR